VCNIKCVLYKEFYISNLFFILLKSCMYCICMCVHGRIYSIYNYILGLFFLAELAVHSLSFPFHIERRKISSKLVQPVQLKRTGLLTCKLFQNYLYFIAFTFYCYFLCVILTILFICVVLFY